MNATKFIVTDLSKSPNVKAVEINPTSNSVSVDRDIRDITSWAKAQGKSKKVYVVAFVCVS